MASDVLCAVLPSLLIRRLRRPLAEKVLLSVLMGFCLIATVAGVFKVIVLNSYDALSENAVADMMTVYLWHVLSSPDCVRASELTRGFAVGSASKN